MFVDRGDAYTGNLFPSSSAEKSKMEEKIKFRI